MTEDKRRSALRFLDRNKPVLLVLLLGVALMLLPGSLFSADSAGESDGLFDTDEEKLAAVLGQIEGTGRVNVLLRQDGDGVCSGAVVVCDGAGSAEVCLRVVRAVSAFTGLGSDRIIVLKMKS